MRGSPARRLAAGAAALLLLLMAGAARAEERPLARVVLMPELIPSVVTQLVPITIGLSSDELPAELTGARASKAEIEALVYCGGDGSGGAWAIGAAYPVGGAAEANMRRPNMLAAPDCQAPLPAIAQRLAHAGDARAWVEIIKAHVIWTPWMLRFAVADTASAGNHASAAPRLSGLRQLKSFSTSDLHVLPPPGEQNRFDVAIGFSDSSIVAALFPARHTSNPAPYLKGDPVLEAELADAPARANTVADAQYGFINALLHLYAPSFEIPLQLQGMSQQLTARNLHAAGGDNTMTLTGQLDFGNVSYSAAVHCEGDDLAIRQVTLVAPPIRCDNADPIAQLQCQAQQAAGGAFGPMLTSIYQGQRFHYSTVDRPLRFTLGDAEFAARFEALRSSSRGATFNEDGNVMIQKGRSRAGFAPLKRRRSRPLRKSLSAARATASFCPRLSRWVG